jgi:hypothetical protein
MSKSRDSGLSSTLSMTIFCFDLFIVIVVVTLFFIILFN